MMKFKLGNLSKIRSKPPWRVLFFGTDEFSLGTLKALYENSLKRTDDQHKVVESVRIVHPRTKKLTAVTRYASLCDLEGYEWPMESQRLAAAYDVGVLASFGHLIPGKLIEAFPYGILNVHPSLLPRWRGAAPLHHTILSGDITTGISIMSIQPKHFDNGPLLIQKKFDVPPACTTFQLRDILAPEGGKMIIETLARLPEAVVEESAQSTEGITYAHKITQSMSLIDWENQDKTSIERQYRALHETLELRTEWDGTPVRLLDMVCDPPKPGILLDAGGPAGLPVFDKENELLWIKCKNGWVAFENIVIRKKMAATSFQNGYLSKSHLQGITFQSTANQTQGEEYETWIRQQRSS